MRLAVLRLDNWTCHRSREIRFAPLTVIRGPNGSGKSSIRDAIDFVLTGTVQRVPLKGMRPMLFNEAADCKEIGMVELVADGLLYRRHIKSGRLQGGCAIEPNGAAVLPFLLTPASFAAASVNERHDLLRHVLRVTADVASHKQALIDAGHPAHLVEDLPGAACDRTSPHSRPTPCASRWRWSA